MGLHLENEVAVVKTPTIISNNPVFMNFALTVHYVSCHCHNQQPLLPYTAFTDWRLQPKHSALLRGTH